MKPAASVQSSSNSQPRSQLSGSKTPVWIRLGIPAACAALAAIFNLAAIKRQIQPVRAYAITESLPMGTRLQASHLKHISLAGDFERSAIVLERELLVQNGEGGKLLPLSASLVRVPRILTHNAKAGEILVKSSLGGIEAPAPNEGSIEVERAKLNMSDDLLRPGRLIHFMLRPKRDRDATKPTRWIGPFRVAWEDLVNPERNSQRKPNSTVRIVFPTRDQKPTADSQALLEAVARPGEFVLYGQLFGSNQLATRTDDTESSVVQALSTQGEGHSKNGAFAVQL